MIEEWKDVAGFEDKYQISNTGYLKHKRTNRISYGFKTKAGYQRVDLSKSPRVQESLHRLVALAFVDNPENKPCVNHKDGNKLNNRLDNLEWCTYSENMIHGFQTSLYKSGSKHKNAKLKEEDVYAITIAKKSGVSSRQLSNYYNVGVSQIDKLVRGEQWKYSNLN